ncbi:SIR2 family protein [Clostridium saudiense]|uniref:SIR2 family protein n=1 Tax=Clostridium saudiense TaxID=1414720 RepID=UPI0018AA1C39
MEEKLKQCLQEFFNDDRSEKVIFIGSGFSKNLGLPTWEEFAYLHLDILKENGKINFETYELLRKDNFRTVISMTKHIILKDEKLKSELYKKYWEVFKIDYTKEFQYNPNVEFLKLTEGNIEEYIKNREKVKKLDKVKDKSNIFYQVYNLNMINVTTNYDDILDILSEEDFTEFNAGPTIPRKKENCIFYSEEHFNEIINGSRTIKRGDIYHIHGSINDIPNMIVSNEDYIKRYWTGDNSFKSFLKQIFDNYNVLFLGYSLQELEIINYLFEGEKGTLDKTDKRRILLLDYFDYEKSRVTFLNDYYESNYGIKLCPYSKSKNGFKVLVDVINQIRIIKDDIEQKKEGYKRCLELIQKRLLTNEELDELLIKLKNYKDLQGDFFSKIHGDFNYLEYLSKLDYFKDDSTNITALIRYLNSISKMVDEVNNKDIEDLYMIMINNINKDILDKNIIFFIANYNHKISEFKLNEFLKTIDSEEFNIILLRVILTSTKEEYMFKFFKENDDIVSDLLCKYIFVNRTLVYLLKRNKMFFEHILENNMFIEKYIRQLEKSYVRNKSERRNYKVEIINDVLRVKSTDNKFSELELRFESLKQIYSDIKKLEVGNKNDLMIAISGLLNENSYSSVFDESYLMNDEKIKLLNLIAEIPQYREILVETLFTKKEYVLKKIALYIVVKNNMIDYLRTKINSNDFDFEYMIRNVEFSGEIKECFRLINNSDKISCFNEENLLGMINRGAFFDFENVTDEENEIWKYRRLRELDKFKLINKEFIKIKSKVEFDYKLSPIIGKIQCGFVESLSSIDLQEATKMNITDWVEFFNKYEEKKHPKFSKRYDLEQDIKIFIQALKVNVDTYLNEFSNLKKIDDYIFMYYIMSELVEVLKDENVNIAKYYKNIVELVNDYIDTLDDIYEEPQRQYVGKKYLVGKICEILCQILWKSREITDELIVKYKAIIEKLEIKVSDNDDFTKISKSDNEVYICFINSVHKKLIDLEFELVLRIKDLEKYDDFFLKVILTRKEKSPKEFYMFLGLRLEEFLNVNKEVTTKLINELDNNEAKNMFLSGIVYSRVINQNQYTLIKPLLEFAYDNGINDKASLEHLVIYCVLAYLLKFEGSNLTIIKRYNLTANSIMGIFNLKDSCKKLSLNFIEKEFTTNILEVWNQVIALDWGAEDYNLVVDTLQVLDDFNNINDDIFNNLKKIMNYVPGNSSLSYKLCDFLEKVLSVENLDMILEIMKNYKSDMFDDDVVELCNKIRGISEEKFNEFKEYWLLYNSGNSPLRTYLLGLE